MDLILHGDHLKVYSSLHILKDFCWLLNGFEIFQKWFEAPRLSPSSCHRVTVAQTRVICCQCQYSHQASPLPVLVASDKRQLTVIFAF